MEFLNFQNNSIWINVLLFAVGAAVIWFAGTRLERCTHAISRKTGLSQAFLGMLLLATSTSLPEIATTVTAVLIGNTTLAVHNLLGGIVMQTAVLAIADGSKRDRGALSFFTPDFTLLIQGVGLVLLLQLVMAGAATGGQFNVAGIGVWPVVIFVAYLLVMFLVYRSQCRPGWIPDHRDGDPGEGSDSREWREQNEERTDDRDADENSDPDAAPSSGPSLKKAGWLFAGFSLMVLVAGWAVARAGDALSSQTGLGASVFGAVFVAIATSLPEISTTVEAARERHYSMAFSNIFGSNALMAALLLLADVLSPGDAIMGHIAPSVLLLTAVGGVVTCIYLWGLLEREDRTVWRIGWDSTAVVVVYAGTLVVLFQMK